METPKSTMMDKLTTEADQFYCELEETGDIENKEQLKLFLDFLIDNLEHMGGRAKGIQYKESER